MNIPEILSAGILLAGLIMYAIFAGADFGGGIWTALASGPRAREQREGLFHAIGPVWETNHVWLIFVVVTLFTAFPRGFAALFTALLTPFVVVLIGINFRGAAFAFRHFGKETGRDVPLIARCFEISSVLTPFFLGMAVTAVATGDIVIEADGTAAGGQWAGPFTIVGGLVGLAICAYLAPVYMTVRTSGDLRDDFRRRGIVAGLALGVLTTVAIPVGLVYAPDFIQKLLSFRCLFFVVMAALLGIMTQLLLWRRGFIGAQICSAVAVALTICGFGAAMYPDILIGEMTFHQAASPPPTLVAFLTVLGLGAVVLVPSLWFLYWTFRGEPDPEAPPGGSEERFRID
jgi:cytochrome d ubiquinol oxidase subunit II